MRAPIVVVALLTLAACGGNHAPSAAEDLGVSDVGAADLSIAPDMAGDDGGSSDGVYACAKSIADWCADTTCLTLAQASNPATYCPTPSTPLVFIEVYACGPVTWVTESVSLGENLWAYDTASGALLAVFDGGLPGEDDAVCKAGPATFDFSMLGCAAPVQLCASNPQPAIRSRHGTSRHAPFIRR